MSPSFNIYTDEAFPSDYSLGLDEWKGLEGLPEETGRAGLDALKLLQDTEDPSKIVPCPRVFISHRQADKDPALRIAELACRAGFDFWLDVLDPNLQRLNVWAGGTPFQRALATAAVIEMGLLNCTHVLAVMTNNTPGTLWVPYEYGRVKPGRLFSQEASAWFDPTRTKAYVPEYMLLGTQHHSEGDIQIWFASEMSRWRAVQRYQRPSLIPSCPAKSWRGPATKPLP